MSDHQDRDLETTRLTPRRSSLRFGHWELVAHLVSDRTTTLSVVDCCAITGGRYAMMIADATVGAVSAGLQLSEFAAWVRLHCNGSSTIPTAMRDLNKRVFDVVQRQGYITMSYAEFDPERGALRFSTAGGCRPILRRRDGSSQELLEDPPGPAMGFFDTAGFSEGEVLMEPGDSLLLCSKDVIDTLEPIRMCGRDRLRAIWEDGGGTTSSSGVAAVLAGIRSFQDRALHGDLKTLPTLREVVEGSADIRELQSSEAAYLRGRPVRRYDMALVVLGAADEAE